MNLKTIIDQQRAKDRGQAVRLYKELRSIRKVGAAMGKSKSWVANAINREISTGCELDILDR